MTRKVHFEVFGRKGAKGGWRLIDALPDRTEAVNRAQGLIDAGDATGVRVMKETYNEETGDFLSLKIFEAGDAAGWKPEPIRGPAELPCFKPQDLYTVHARARISKLLREQLAHWRLTAMELIHRADALERLDATGTTLQHAIQKAAVAHAGSTQQDVHDTVKKFQALVAKAITRVYQDERGGRFPEIGEGGLKALAGALAAGEEPEYLLSAAIARHIADAPGWGAKLEKLLGLITDLPTEEEPRELALETIDAFVAEMMQGSAALADLLGEQHDLGSALKLMADLFLGKLGKDVKVSAGVHALNAEFARGKLPESRIAIAQRILNELRSVRRLCPDSLDEEVRVIRVLATKMVMGQGPHLSIDEITDAFTLRAKRLVNAETIEEYIRCLDAHDEKIEKLIRLEENVVGAENKRALATFILPLISANQMETAFVDAATPITERLKRLAELQREVCKASFQDLNRRQIAEALDAVGLRALRKARLFESIDARGGSIADKALAILRLAVNGVLPEGDCHAEARRALARYVQHPGFMTALTTPPKNTDPEKFDAAKRVEAFRTLLARSGLDPAAAAKSSAA
jgi:hypothetical protein